MWTVGAAVCSGFLSDWPFDPCCDEKKKKLQTVNSSVTVFTQAGEGNSATRQWQPGVFEIEKIFIHVPYATFQEVQ